MWPMFCAINPFSLTLNTSKHLRFCTCPNFFVGLIWALYGGIYCQGELPLQQVKQCLYATRAVFSSSSQHNPAKTNIETNNKCCTLIGGRIPLLGSPSFIWGRGNYPLINQHPNIKHPLPYHQSHNHGFWGVLNIRGKRSIYSTTKDETCSERWENQPFLQQV